MIPKMTNVSEFFFLKNQNIRKERTNKMHKLILD